MSDSTPENSHEGGEGGRGEETQMPLKEHVPSSQNDGKVQDDSQILTTVDTRQELPTFGNQVWPICTTSLEPWVRKPIWKSLHTFPETLLPNETDDVIPTISKEHPLEGTSRVASSSQDETIEENPTPKNYENFSSADENYKSTLSTIPETPLQNETGQQETHDEIPTIGKEPPLECTSSVASISHDETTEEKSTPKDDENSSSADDSSKETEHKVPIKWIIVLDTAKDNTGKYFEVAGTKMNSLTMLKLCLQHCLIEERLMKPQDQIALITMNKTTATWVYGYSSNMEGFNNALTSVKECKPKNTFNLDSVFKLIIQNDEICKKSKLNVPIDYNLRIMLLYARSNTVPVITISADVNLIINSPYVNIDILTTHVKVDDKFKKVNDCLSKLHKRGLFFAVGRDTTDLYDAMDAILLHAKVVQ